MQYPGFPLGGAVSAVLCREVFLFNKDCVESRAFPPPQSGPHLGRRADRELQGVPGSLVHRREDAGVQGTEPGASFEKHLSKGGTPLKGSKGLLLLISRKHHFPSLTMK
ncbi:hypothetical protein NDU88_000756 [Pleurodeles waltl]|uniref:Uncharacterized protein n=1 Tax=Pleurodeles waltl TaxID=8319 RepID=A0AAV7KMV7_PLEWA|nr:hypothetical protein NDU88_000756 [Pleurodeles waltl]